MLLQQMGIQPGDKIGVRAFIEAVKKQANPDGGNNSGNSGGGDGGNGDSGNGDKDSSNTGS